MTQKIEATLILPLTIIGNLIGLNESGEGYSALKE